MRAADGAVELAACKTLENTYKQNLHRKAHDDPQLCSLEAHAAASGITSFDGEEDGLPRSATTSIGLREAPSRASEE